MTIVQNKAAIYDELQLIANYFLSQSIVASFYKNLPKMVLFLNKTCMVKLFVYMKH